MSNKLVKDYLGNLVPKNKARKIHDRYYVEGESCFLMPDGQWYRITSTDKIVLDHYTKSYVLVENNELLKGIINENGDIGKFCNNEFVVEAQCQKKGTVTLILNEKLAKSLGYEESISDGRFYKISDLTEKDKRDWFNKKNIPATERSKNYNLENNPERKKELMDAYENLELKISPIAKRLSKFIGDYTFGCEWELINGFLPSRIKSRYGIKALKDGSLRSDTNEGIELVSMPMKGAKGIEVIRQVCQELSRRAEVNNYCSFHIHFGNVKKDKLHTLSLYRLGLMLQTEMVNYFPYSRFHSIKSDGKVYCNLLPANGVEFGNILKQKSEEDFHKSVLNEFDKIYRWLNCGKGLAEVHGEPKIVRTDVVVDGKKMFYDKWLKNIYSTKTIHHSIEGEKWQKNSRYFWLNLLNLYFSKIGTVEFRPHDGSVNSTKCLIWLVICASILKYSENIKQCLTLKSITLKEVLEENVGEKYTEYIMAYLKLRHEYFFLTDGSYREYKRTEKAWFAEDNEFNFVYNNMEIK